MEINYNNKTYIYEEETTPPALVGRGVWFLMHKGKKLKVRSWRIKAELNQIMLIYDLTETIYYLNHKYGFALSFDDEVDLENKVQLSRSLTRYYTCKKTPILPHVYDVDAPDLTL